MVDAVPSIPRPDRRLVAAAAWGALPWTWFAVRDVSGLLDLVAALLPLLVLVVLAATAATAAVRRSAALAAAGVSWLLFGLVVVLAPVRAEETGPPRDAVTVAVANVAARGERAAELAATLDGPDAGVLVVAELPESLHARLDAASPWALADLPRVADADPPRPDIGVYSSLRLTRLDSPTWFPGIRVRVEAPAPFVLYALHVPRPGFGETEYSLGWRAHRRLVERIAALAGAERAPVVVAGDLNSSDRGGDYRALRRVLRDAMRTETAAPTFVWPSALWRVLRLRIDHVLIPPAWCAAGPKRLPLPGGDHRAIRVDVGPCGATT